ncbi:MFS transporter [Allonocardiopsis opalescens]|uniref:Sugar phosphate permease n=1 Tax=Allonocardiopsis opalescens TaxID=1144618 RepID=A0A2T0PXD2_9ACTN|nr:MFS transporter [Allonocardiopsis opalescens]PRX96192.1 sugar phosphate permease [Allonocardiopsis opalescens]
MAVALYFLLCGAIMATWTVRLPAIKENLQLTDGQISLGLLAMTGGAFAAMQFAGVLVDRVGSRPVTAIGVTAALFALVGPGLATSLPTLMVLLLVLGVFQGLGNVAMNVQAVQVERAYRRPIMSSMHAVFSLGGLAGALYGGAAAGLGLSPLATFALAGAVLVPVSLLAARHLLPGTTAAKPRPAAAEAAQAPQRGALAGWTPLLALMGVVSMFCLIGEGAAADWSAVYLRDTLHSTEAVAALGYAAFSVTMTTGRLVGDRLAAAFGAVNLVRAGGTLAAAGLGAALLVPSPWLAIAGFGAFGLGLSCIVPQVFTAAGNIDPARAGRNIARVSGFGYLGLFSGPVLIGALAELTSLRLALAAPALLALVAVAAAGALRRPAARRGDEAVDHGSDDLPAPQERPAPVAVPQEAS